MENPDVDVNSEAPAAREIKQSGRALISAALVPLDRLGNLDGDMRPLLGLPFKCSGCGSRDVSLWLFAKRAEVDVWSKESGPGF
jgi:hypothetical protein